MPTYPRRCIPCGEDFELRRSIRDDSPMACPKCGGTETEARFDQLPTMFTRKIDHPDSPLDDLPGAETMRKQADYAINKTLKDMGMSPY